MKPEEKFASKLLERHNLIPPYNLEELVSLYAEVGFLDFPLEADGISLGLKQSNKPRIYINSLRPEVRQRFTLAHELGHVIIPWHIGNIVSHTEVKGNEEETDSDSQINRNGDYEYRQIEGEANRFAAELLIPTSWLGEILKNVNIFNFEEVLLEVMQQSATSKDTTLIKVFNALPPGYVCAEIDGGKMVVNSFMSPSTQVYKLSLETDCTSEPYLIYKEKITFNLGSKNYILWNFENSIELPDELGNELWREILNTILEDTGLQSKRQNINAILPSLFQSIKEKSDSEIFSSIVHRYSEREDLKDFIQHPLSEQYIVKRLKELRLKYPRYLPSSRG
ncbi:MAG: ImmA/IrrE family metallo-endopeptidase [Tildeniella nuda ZEHNDER 1965/U140]|jgi:Zn-dependent peptidase ImmA (M78 family)|nr:ImmA/IrrE family metallo-endopeptidase [Tildeniella nuda ZEHNDER 1965/U140]